MSWRAKNPSISAQYGTVDTGSNGTSHRIRDMQPKL